MYVLLLTLLISITVNTKASHPKKTIFINNDTILFNKHLEIEDNYSLEVEEEYYNFMDNVLVKFSTLLEKNSLDLSKKTDKRKILSLIHQSILYQRIKIKNDNESNLLSYSIKESEFDCDKLVLIYLSFAEIYKFNIKAIYIPGHIFIRWKSENESIYWEATAGKEFQKSDYLEQIRNKHPISYKKIEFLEMTHNDIIGLIHFNVAMNFLLKNQFTQSFIAFNKSLRFTKKISEIYVGKAFINSLYSNHYSAIFDYSMAIKTNPYNYQYYLSRSKLYLKVSNLKNAMLDISKSLKLNPYDAENYYQKAIIHLESRNFQEAYHEFSNAIKLNSSHHLKDLGEISKHLSKNNLKSAITALVSFLEENISFKLAYYLLAESFTKIKRFHASNFYYNNIIKLDRYDAKPFFFKALNFFKMKNKEKAIESLNNAIRINPNYKEAKEMRIKIGAPLHSELKDR